MTPQESVAFCVCGDPACLIPYGYCHCGCGRITSICKMSSTKFGFVKGTPRKIIKGHAKVSKRKDVTSAAQFKIEGVYCRLIALTRGQYAIVDATDYEWLMQWMWFSMKNTSTGRFYAARMIYGETKQCMLMHRQILGLSIDDPRTGDHIDNMATLENRKKNLRIATEVENSQNRLLNRNNTSGFKGVSFSKSSGLFRAEIAANGKKMILGHRTTAEAAFFELYVPASLKYHGDFSRLK